MKTRYFEFYLAVIIGLLLPMTLQNACKSNGGGSGGGGDSAPPSPTAPLVVATQPPVVVGGTGTQTPLGTPTTSGTPGGQVDFTYVLAEDIKTQCAGQGKMVDRAKRACLEAALDQSKPCTPDAIAAAFGSSGQAVTQKISELVGQGFQIDQCGTLNGKPYVSLYKTFADNGLAKIQTQYLAPGP